MLGGKDRTSSSGQGQRLDREVRRKPQERACPACRARTDAVLVRSVETSLGCADHEGSVPVWQGRQDHGESYIPAQWNVGRAPRMKVIRDPTVGTVLITAVPS
jgi:hypothetical protein